MMPCANCQHLVDDNANFCDQCGERLQGEPPPFKPLPRFDEPPRFPRFLARLLAVVATAVIVGLAAALLRNEGPTQPRQQTLPGEPGDGANLVIPEPVLPEPPTSGEVLASQEETALRVELNCEGCEVTLLAADGSEPRQATVTGGAAEFQLPTRSTLGAALSVTHPQGFGHESGYNIAVLSPADAEIGQRVTVSDVAEASAVGVCWSGTTSSRVSVRLAVEAFSNPSDVGGLRVWSPSAEPVLESPVAPAGDGTVDLPALAVCQQAYEALSG